MYVYYMMLVTRRGLVFKNYIIQRVFTRTKKKIIFIVDKSIFVYGF